jgi:hypothetical protein
MISSKTGGVRSGRGPIFGGRVYSAPHNDESVRRLFRPDANREEGNGDRTGACLTRRATLAAVAAGFGVAAFGGSAKAQAAPRTFVLVHGSWHGGWCWRRVSNRLEKLGHKVSFGSRRAAPRSCRVVRVRPDRTHTMLEMLP